jgi:hypothetical protein
LYGHFTDAEIRAIRIHLPRMPFLPHPIPFHHDPMLLQAPNIAAQLPG